MSGLYNMLMGHNPAFGLLCAMVGITRDTAQFMGRVRDAWISEDAKTIGVLHRNYGEDGEFANQNAAKLPNFREQQACDDSTYQVWLFDVPPEGEEIAKQIAEHSDNTPCWERYTQAIVDMRAGKETPQTKHMMDVGKKIMGGLSESLKDGESRTVETEDGGIDIIAPGGGGAS